MDTDLWSWLLSVVGITGLWVAGSGKRWALNLGGQVPWFAYAIQIRQWGFVPAAIAYSIVFARNYLKRRDQGSATLAFILATSTWAANTYYLLGH